MLWSSCVIGIEEVFLNTPVCVVVIPAYNAANTVVETLLALQQTDSLNEVLKVVMLDDCSTDDTVCVARAAWTSTTPFEIWANESNMGERRTVNRAFAQLNTATEWIFILHADDVVKPNWLALYFAAMQGLSENTASICSSYDVWWSDTGKIEPGEDVLEPLFRIIPGGLDSVRGTLERGCWWHISGCAIRSAAFRAIGPFAPDMPQLGDWEWVLRCLAKEFDIVYIPRTTMRYRQHSTSISSNSFREGRDLRERLRVLELVRNQGFIDAASYRARLRGTFFQILRRLLVRAVRWDWRGFRSHLKVSLVAARQIFRG